MDVFSEETIAAISTAQAPAGIGIVRISGEKASEVADRIFRGPSGKKLADQKGNTVHYGWIEQDGQLLDEVLAMVLRAPHSYTGEDTVELQCHGGVFATNSVLEAVLRSGARIAEPGEFTKRAFLNGRIDLSRAEAVMDIISAKSRYAQESSASQLAGSLYNKISGLRTLLLEELAFIESALDDPEHYTLDGYEETLLARMSSAKEQIENLLSTAEQGKYIGEGIRTVILGKPNAGKSSILNALTGKDRAIVTEIPGTTRDVLTENLSIDGIGLILADTAGIRRPGDKVEEIGIGRALQEAEDADLILYIADASVPADEEDREILQKVSGKKVILVLNKEDLPSKTTEEELKAFFDGPVVVTAAVSGSGIDELKKTIRDLFFNGEIRFNDEVYITNARHKAALEETGELLENVESAVSCGIPEDVYAADLYGAVSALDRIIGGNASEDLVDTIFSKFCMGK